MPSLCNYGMCHNLGSSTYQGYCNEYHMKRAKLLEMKEQVSKLEEELRLLNAPVKETQKTPEKKE
jgi:hypothetical protein